MTPITILTSVQWQIKYVVHQDPAAPVIPHKKLTKIVSTTLRSRTDPVRRVAGLYIYIIDIKLSCGSIAYIIFFLAP